MSAVNNTWHKHFMHTGIHGADEYEAVMAHTSRQIASLFERLTKPYSALAPRQLEATINRICLDSGGRDLESVIDTAIELVAKNSIIVQHPHCIAHLHTPPFMSAIAAEALISVLNQSMDSWDQASAATYVEQKVINWLCSIYDLGSVSDGVFTSGGTQSNQIGLLLARDWVAEKINGHSIQKLGLPDYASKLRILCSKTSHFTVQKTSSLMGLGEQAVVCIDTNKDGTINIDALRDSVEDLKREGLIPFALVATAGTTDHGAIDHINMIADIAENHSIWLHVDGAYGGALIFSQHKHRLRGIERADSVSIDFHKLFYQTISCGAVLIKNSRNLKYLLHHADYLNREHDELPNLVDKSLATTRRFDALKVFMTMQNVGPKVLGQMYDHLIEQAQQVAELVESHSSFELLAPPSLSTVLFRLVNQCSVSGGGIGQNKSDDSFLNQLNQNVRIEALIRGIAVIGETRLDGKSALKFTILNPCLTLSDFESLLFQIDLLAKEQLQSR